MNLAAHERLRQAGIDISQLSEQQRQLVQELSQEELETFCRISRNVNHSEAVSNDEGTPGLAYY